MSKRTQKYTTIQVKIDTAELIRSFCSATGRSISGTTEVLWLSFISASISGSLPIYTP